MEAPTINYDMLAPDPRDRELMAMRAERDRAQTDCERLGCTITAPRAALLRIMAIIETQAEPDIDAMHDVARDALNR